MKQQRGAIWTGNWLPIFNSVEKPLPVSRSSQIQIQIIIRNQDKWLHAIKINFSDCIQKKVEILDEIKESDRTN